MSVQQGLISPPLSGRADKTDPPRIQDAHKLVNAHDVFHRTSTTSAPHVGGSLFQHHHDIHHTIRSPVKKRRDDLSDAERAVRPLTPPMSKDVRHDQDMDDGQDYECHRRINSEGDHFNAPTSSTLVAPRVAAQPSCPQAPVASAGLMAAAPIADRFHTLNQGVPFESDDEHNPFLDRRPLVASSSASKTTTAAWAHHSHPYHDEFDSDQDAEGSVHEDDLDRDCGSETTPRGSSSQATTPPPRRGQVVAYRPARPFSDRVRVENEPVTSTMPIRDTPKNPFLAGGPADNGFHGPNGHVAYRRAQHIPGKERGKIAYVFRGQRVTYADPEYASDEDDSDLEDIPHRNAERPPRLQPKLLFPPTASISSSQSTQRGLRSSCVPQSSSAQSSSRGGDAPGAYRSRAAEVTEAVHERGTSSSSTYSDEAGHLPRTGGGLFAAQIAAQRKQQVMASERRSELTAPSSSARLQSITHGSQAFATDSEEGRQAARKALLARLDQTNWSDDDEDRDGDECGNTHRRGWDRRDGEAPVVQEERPMERHALSRSQSHCKRLSDELQRGHAEETDVLGRPMKRSRASYAY